MSKDIVELIVEHARDDNDRKVDLNKFICQLEKFSISSEKIYLDSVVCKKMLEQVASQYHLNGLVDIINIIEYDG